MSSSYIILSCCFLVPLDEKKNQKKTDSFLWFSPNDFFFSDMISKFETYSDICIFSLKVITHSYSNSSSLTVWYFKQYSLEQILRLVLISKYKFNKSTFI